MAEEVDGVSTEQAVAELLGQEVAEAPEKSEEVDTAKALEEAAARAEEELAAGEKGEEPVEKDELEDLISSKGGRQKFVAGLHEQWKSTAKLAKEIEELKAKLSDPAPAEDPEPEEELTHPDIDYYTQEIANLDSEVVSNESAKDLIVKQGNEIQAAIHELKGELKRADDLEKDALQTKIDRQEAKLERLADKYKSLDARNKQIGFEKRGFERGKQLAERELSAHKQQLQTQKLQEQAWINAESVKFSTAIAAAQKEYNFPDGPGGESGLEHIDGVIRAEASYLLRSKGKSDFTLDLEQFVKDRAAHHAKMMGIVKTKEFAKTSKEKVELSSKPPVQAKPQPTPPDPQPTSKGSNKAWSADFARLRASKILGG